MVRPKRLAVSGDKPGQIAYRESLLWWQARLTEGLVVPLAPRHHFPTPGAPGCVVVCTDAAREAGTGLGGYAPVEVGGELIFYYVEARWPSDILLALQENRISMPAGELFTMVVTIAAVAEELEGVSHVIGFTDSDATRAAVTSGASPAPQLNCMVMWLQRAVASAQFLAIHQPGKRNDAADGISRSNRRGVLGEVRSVGWRTRRLPLPRGAWELAHRLLALPPAVPP